MCLFYLHQLPFTHPSIRIYCRILHLLQKAVRTKSGTSIHFFIVTGPCRYSARNSGPQEQHPQQPKHYTKKGNTQYASQFYILFLSYHCAPFNSMLLWFYRFPCVCVVYHVDYFTRHTFSFRKEKKIKSERKNHNPHSRSHELFKRYIVQQHMQGTCVSCHLRWKIFGREGQIQTGCFAAKINSNQNEPSQFQCRASMTELQ